LATVSAALFQLVMAWRSRSKVDTGRKKGTTARSILSILALMVASAAGGFLYSEFLKQRNAEDMRAMRDELKDLRALIAQGRDRAHVRRAADAAGRRGDADLDDGEGVEANVESIAYVPACRRTDSATACAEADAQRIALCGTGACVRPRRPHRAVRAARCRPASLGIAQGLLEQDLGGARFTGKSFEYAQANELKAVCVNFMQWSSEHPHIARIRRAVRLRRRAPSADAPAEAASHGPAVIAGTARRQFPTPPRSPRPSARGSLSPQKPRLCGRVERASAAFDERNRRPGGTPCSDR
jgi:hypothetical protein